MSLRETLERNTLLLGFLRGMHHQPAQIRVPAAGLVGLAVAVVKHIHAGGALQGQRLVDDGGRMYGKVKRLRAAGGRLSDHDIARANFVEGEITLAGLSATLVLSVVDPNSEVGASLLPQLYDARLITMTQYKMLFKGEERPQAMLGLPMCRNGR
jgi:hypothetical protein